MQDVTNEVKKRCDKMSSEDKQTRRRATAELLWFRSEVSSQVREIMRKCATKPDPSWESTTHLALQVLGRYRDEDAIPIIIGIIDYQIDKSTVPAGDKLARSAYFPAAAALSEMGGQYVAKSLVARLQKEENEKVIRICVWTLFKVCGNDVAAFMLDDEATKHKDEKDEKVRQRLGKAKELLKEGDSLLPPPDK
jgi:HEAT repeat protein